MIAGAFSTGTELAEGVLARMMAALDAYPADLQDAWQDRRCALGARLMRIWTPLPKRALEAMGAARIAFIGRLDNRDELAAALREPADRPDSELVAAAYARWGDAVPNQLNGDFCLAILHPDRHRLLLARDPMGTVPLYFSQIGDTIFFGSAISSLLAAPGVPAELDVNAIAETFVGASRLGAEQTFFKGIHALPPGEVLLSDARGTRRSMYWTFSTKVARVVSFDEAAGRYREALIEAVRRRTSRVDRMVFLLSGGLDSSALVCLASRLHAEGRGCEPIAVTFTESDGSAADERRFIAAVDAFTGGSTHHVNLAPVDFAALTTHYARFAEAPLLLPNPGTFVRVVDFARAHDARVLCAGVFGDQVNIPYPPGHFVTLFRQLRWWRLWREQREIERWFSDVPAHDLRADTTRYLLRHHVPSWARELRRRIHNPRDSAPFYTARLKSAISDAGTPDARVPHEMRRLYELVRWTMRLRGTEAGYRMDVADGIHSCAPFFDRDFVQTLFSIPAKYHFWRGMPRALMRLGMTGYVPEPILQRREKGDYTGPISAGIVADRDVVMRGILSGRAVTLGLLDHDAVARERERWARTNVDNADVASYLHEWWELEQFLAHFFPQPGASS